MSVVEQEMSPLEGLAMYGAKKLNIHTRDDEWKPWNGTHLREPPPGRWSDDTSSRGGAGWIIPLQVHERGDGSSMGRPSSRIGLIMATDDEL